MSAPVGSPFLAARWIHLAMANYLVDPALLEPLVPAGTELDRWGGKTLMSVVGFQFVDTRVLGIAIPFHRHFDEVNLRFYVRRTAAGEVRRGVVFIKEIVPRPAIAWLANALYNEKYVALPMWHDDGIFTARRAIRYGWRHARQAYHLEMACDGELYRADPDSEEAFITEHYWGYTGQRDGSTLEYRVEHPRWNVWKGTQPELVGDLGALYGSQFSPFFARGPDSCFVADGSAILVRRGIKIQT